MNTDSKRINLRNISNDVDNEIFCDNGSYAHTLPTNYYRRNTCKNNNNSKNRSTKFKKIVIKNLAKTIICVAAIVFLTNFKNNQIIADINSKIPQILSTHFSISDINNYFKNIRSFFH